MRQAAAQALGLIKNPQAVEPLIATLQDPDGTVRQAAAEALGLIKNPQAVEPLIATLRDPDSSMREAAAKALGQIGDVRAIEALNSLLNDDEASVRRAVLQGMASQLEDRIDQRLLSRDCDAVSPWLDPREPIGEKRLAMAAKHLQISVEEARRRYEALTERFQLRLVWPYE